MNVAYCFDRGYAAFAAVSTYSLFTNSGKNIQVYWVVPQEDQPFAVEARHSFADDLKKNITLVSAETSMFANWKELFHFTRGMYLRLLLPQLIPEDKVIYLDADTIVQSNLNNLYQLELGENLIAGVVDPGGKDSRVPRLENDPYINSGVMLMNLNAMRLDHSIKKFTAIYERFQELATWPDQCLINKYAEGKKLVLNEKWNRLLFSNGVTESQFLKISNKKHACIMHFIGPIKPWQKWCNPCITKFWLAYASRLDALTISMADITTLEQALTYAQVLDLNRKFEESTFIKSNVIRNLLDMMPTEQ